MLRMMLGGQILPAANVVGPVSETGRGKVEAGRNLALQRVPSRINVRRPEQRSVALRAQVSVARKNERALLHVAPEAVINRRRMKQRVDIEVARARSYVEVAAVRRQVGFGLIHPQGVETLAQHIIANSLPIPTRRFRI